VKNYKYLMTVRVVSLIFLDLLSYYTALFLAVFIRTNVVSHFFRPIPPLIFSFEYFASIWWIPLLLLFVTAFEKLYTVRYPFWEEVKAVLKTTLISLLFVFFLVSVRNIFGDISRLTFLLLWVFLSVIMPLVRYWGKILLNLTGIWSENVLVIGAGPSAVETVKGLTNEKQMGYRVLGFLDDDPRKIGRNISIGRKTYKVFGKISRFREFVYDMKVSTVIIAMPHLSREQLAGLTTNVQRHTRSVMVVPDLAGIAQINTELHYLFMQKIFLLKIRNNLKSGLNRRIKRAFDLVLAVLLLPFLLPALLVIVVLIKLDSKGPAFIIQDRLGINDSIFKCIKFRTMYIESDAILTKHLRSNPEARKEWKTFKKLRKYDPRVTRFGKFLRKTSLDEFPQIFNVLRGNMSLIGPRPYLPREKKEIKSYVDIILFTTPGVTGLWQISGRNELSFEERLKLDTWYVQNWSLWLDIIILFKTVEIILTRKGAY
jgi:Undecaprenyl-phosphate galactose phosphotransferase WbaP